MRSDMNSAARTGLIVGLAVLFVVLIGLYGVFETLTLSGTLLSIQGATAAEVAAQKPTLTNPDLGRVLLAILALLTGALAARGRHSFLAAILRGSIASGLAGLILAAFDLLMNGLISAGLDVHFVFDKVNATLVKEIALGQPVVQGAIILILGSAVCGAVGGGINFGWRAIRARGAMVGGQKAARASSRSLQSAVIVVVLLLLVLLPLRIGIYWNQVLGSIGLFVLLGLGLNIVVGFAGLLDLGYVGFFAIGAYVVAVLTSPDFHFDWSFWLAVPFALAATGLSGILLGIPVLRLRGDYLAIVTLGFGEIIRIIFKFNPLTGGPQGILNVGLPNLSSGIRSLPRIEFSSSTPFFYLILVACAVTALIAIRLNDSRIGRAWIAMREDEDAAASIGIDTVRMKLLAFALGAVFAGLGGAIYASRQHAIFPDDFTILVSINALSLIIIGGMGSIPGVIIGSVVLIGLPEVLRPVSDYRLLTYSALLVLMMILRPEGIIPSSRRRAEIHELPEEAEALGAAPQSAPAG